MIQRMIGAAKLHVPTFEDIENDGKATSQALVVVILVALASGIGALIAATMSDAADKPNAGVAFVGGLVLAIVTWAIWAGLTYLIGTTILKTPQTHASWAQLARVTGFAQTPGLLGIFSFIPVLGPLIGLAAVVWRIVAMVIGVRSALDYASTWRAVGVVLIGVAVVILVGVIAALAFGIGLAGMAS